MQPPAGRLGTRTTAHDGTQFPRHNTHRNKPISFLPLAAALMLASCVGPQPVWLDMPPAGADEETRMLPVASGITQGELSELLRENTGNPWGNFGDSFFGNLLSVSYLGTKSEPSTSWQGGEIDLGLWFGLDKVFARLGAMFLESKGNEGNFAGVGLGYYFYLPHSVSPYVGIAGMLGYADADSESVVALLPEIGVNLAAIGKNDFTMFGVGARYFLSTQGRDDGFWLFGVTLTVVTLWGD